MYLSILHSLVMKKKGDYTITPLISGIEQTNNQTVPTNESIKNIAQESLIDIHSHIHQLKQGVDNDFINTSV